MGAITPVLGAVGGQLIPTIVGSVTSRDDERNEAKADLQRRQIELEQQAKTIARSDELREDLAKQRARFASQGRVGNSGSAAVILGDLLTRSARDEALERSETALKIERLGLQNQRESLGQNLLEKGASAASKSIVKLLD